MSRVVAILCTLVAGGVVALQPPANAALARHVSDLGAAFISGVITVSCWRRRCSSPVTPAGCPG